MDVQNKLAWSYTVRYGIMLMRVVVITDVIDMFIVSKILKIVSVQLNHMYIDFLLR